MANWAACALVERNPDRVSGVWVVKGTRITVDAVLSNAGDCTPEQIALMFPGLSADVARQIIDFANHPVHAHSA